MGEDGVQAERSSAVNSHETQDLVVPSPSPTQSSPSHSLNQLGTGGAAGKGTGEAGGEGSSQVNAITVLTLLDKLVNMLDTVQENQHKMEQRQAEMETAVRGIQSDMTKLSKSHTSTSNTVSKLLEKSRKVSVHMKEVKDKMDKQAVQVKKLEANHAHLLKRNNFKVLIFQEENEIPSSVFVKDPVPYPRGPEAEEEPPTVDANRSQEETLQTISLSSDEELGHEDEEEEVGGVGQPGERLEQTRAEKIKRSSLKKVDSLKKAFSRHNIEKKMSKISTKIVSPEKREKIKKSLTPNHQKNPSAKSSSFKVSPLTFNVKKMRDGDTVPKAEESPSAVASIELEPLSSPDEEAPFTVVHSHLAPAVEEGKSASDSVEKEQEEEELPSPRQSSVATGGLEAELTIVEDDDPQYTLSSTLPHDELHHQEEEACRKAEEKMTEITSDQTP
ncbi:caveolae-associated protein 2 [Lepisosteus oculatus]|uniref:Caveolae associated protein 2b n=1 Tax=Lepisosteus oculatus TaxID=7918 RepID=W5MCQ0_LEPOC|nr:PREDICTED: serum deprivation-response protein [Lepisosteus oculatus]